ncbi:MAG: phosphoribosyltransferase family protein [Candidatus Atabeyarchaeum deiterrae]
MFPPNVECDPKFTDRAEIFKDRMHAGRMLAERLADFSKKQQSIVVAIPSGGVPVGYAIAMQLQIPLDVMLVRKIPVPWETEAGFGSVTFDGSTFLNDSLVKNLGLSNVQISESIDKAKKGLQERTQKFAAIKKEGLLTSIRGRAVILVDDGLASGYTMIASVDSIKKREARKVVVAVPTGSIDAINLVSPKVDKLLCLNVRSGYRYAVADAYKEWYDVPEEEALKLLRALQAKE